MSCRIVCLALLLVTAWSSGDADGQILRRIRERRAALSAPPSDPTAPEVASPDPASPQPSEAVPPWRGFIARRLQMRRDLVAQQAVEAEPTLAPPMPPQSPRTQQRAYAARQPLPQQPIGARRQPPQGVRQASAQADLRLPPVSREQIATMDVNQLQGTLADASAALMNGLNRFSSAESWQGFLDLPAGIVDEPSIDREKLQSTLNRFERVADDQQFSQIAGLDSFQQTRFLLNELLNRAGAETEGRQVAASQGPQLIAPGSNENSGRTAATSEPLPSPEPALPRAEGEHSILIQSNR